MTTCKPPHLNEGVTPLEGFDGCANVELWKGGGHDRHPPTLDIVSFADFSTLGRHGHLSSRQRRAHVAKSCMSVSLISGPEIRDLLVTSGAMYLWVYHERFPVGWNTKISVAGQRNILSGAPHPARE
ncbi:hypothetical protein FA13DRAFT_1078776 [Coprinellus micaceus]|uniref:Uncharacterized protein n=1 Tax=Coprinellus micaceus TaxID=71717 RepID=A0A4Y7TT09_COPMI|nr:hypothetical protein FA13DRAFT_1078776 [Coprinellus micaceus]